MQKLEQLEHIRRSRTLANQDIIRKLAEGKKETKSHSEGLIAKLLWRRKCEMEIEDLGRYEQGVCTRSGSCRLMGNDYIFQGGCGELSRSNSHRYYGSRFSRAHYRYYYTTITLHSPRWGRVPLSGQPRCTMLVLESRVVEGRCTQGGHCWSKYEPWSRVAWP